MVDLTKDYEHRNRAWYKIAYKRFLVRIPSYLVPRDDTEMSYGTFTTGSRYADRVMAGAEECIWLTLIDLINIWSAGGCYAFIKASRDIPIIHGILQEHIEDFEVSEQWLASGLYYEDESILNQRRRDMLELDAYAREIYRRAFRHDPPPTGIFKGFREDISPLERAQLEAAKQSTKPVPKYNALEVKVDYSALRNRRNYSNAKSVSGKSS